MEGWGLVHSECKEMYSYLFTEAELESCLLECQRRLHMYSANVQTDSLLMFAAVKLRLVKASARFHRWMMSIRTEQEKEASIGELCPHSDFFFSFFFSTDRGVCFGEWRLGGTTQG